MIISDVYDNFDAAQRVYILEVANNITFRQFISGQIAFNRQTLTQIQYENPQELERKYQEIQNAIKF